MKLRPQTPLAWRNLVHDRLRLAIAVTGVAISIILVFMQFGFHGTVEGTATVIYKNLDFDIALRSPDYHHLAEAGFFPKDRLHQAASVEGVEFVRPFSVGVQVWTLPKSERSRVILVMGIEPRNSALRQPEIVRKAPLLSTADRVLIDRKSRPEFSPIEGPIGDRTIGSYAEIGDHGMTIAEHFEMGTGLAADGAVLMNPAGFAEAFGGVTRGQVSLGLVKVADGYDVDRLAAALKQHLPDDVQVRTRDQVYAQERRRWVWETPIGMIFTAGSVLAVIVGMAIVYQILATDVARKNKEYATLKSIGYTNVQLTLVILAQAVYLSALGYLAALVLTLGLYDLTSRLANIELAMNGERMIAVFALALGMCAASGWIASRKVREADPADLF